VREASVKRRLIGHCSATSDSCFAPECEIADVLDHAEQGIYDLAQSRRTDGFHPASQAVKEGFDLIEHAGGALPGLDTGFTDLNLLTGGLMPADQIILAARPSMGKTALALNIAVNVAKTGVGVALFSLEMSRPQIGLRMIVSEARVDGALVRAGHLQESDYQKLVMAANVVNDLPIWIDDRSDLSVLEIRAGLRRLKRKHDFGLVVVDYIQLMGGTRAETREQEVSSYSRGLKGIAKSFNVPVLALSQLNRKVEDRPKKRPMLADLRESGAIEQDADVIAFIHRPEYYGRTDENRGLAEIIIAKQRNGPTDTVKLTFLEQFTRFEDYVREVNVQ
jgi:replicative DNA helicase